MNLQLRSAASMYLPTFATPGQVRFGNIRGGFAHSFCCVQQVPAAAPTPLPPTPASALRRGSLSAALRSTRRKSTSFDTPMEGVPERHGFVLQPKTPSWVRRLPPFLWRPRVLP